MPDEIRMEIHDTVQETGIKTIPCIEIKENNRMGMIRDLFKKIRDNQGTFFAKMGTI